MRFRFPNTHADTQNHSSHFSMRPGVVTPFRSFSPRTKACYVHRQINYIRRGLNLRACLARTHIGMKCVRNAKARLAGVPIQTGGVRTLLLEVLHARLLEVLHGLLLLHHLHHLHHLHLCLYVVLLLLSSRGITHAHSVQATQNTNKGTGDTGPTPSN